MSQIYMRRAQGEATGPTEAEFATEGATFLVGMITPWRKYRLFPQYQATPIDYQYTSFDYLDTLPVLIGGTSLEQMFGQQSGGTQLERMFGQSSGRVGALFGQGQKTLTPGQQKALLEAKEKKRADKLHRQQTRQQNRTGDAARALLAWAKTNEVEVHDMWTAGENGNGFIFQADDEFTLNHMNDKAKSIARDPRYKSYATIIASVEPGKYLAAFVREPQMIPVNYDQAISLAITRAELARSQDELHDALQWKTEKVKPSAPISDDDGDYGPVGDELTPEQRRKAMEAIMRRSGLDMEGEDDAEGVRGFHRVRGFQVGTITVTPLPGTSVGKIGDFFKKTFGPKKVESIQKKIDKLKAQIEDLEARKKEAAEKEEGGDKKSEGMVIGNIHGLGSSSMLSRFQGAQRYADSYQRGMFREAAEDGSYNERGIPRFSAAEDQRYADAYQPTMFHDAESVDYDAQDPSMFVDAEDVHYTGDLDGNPSYDFQDIPMFEDAEDVHYTGSLEDLRIELQGLWYEALQAGELTQDEYDHNLSVLPGMSDDEVLAELENDAVEVGAGVRGGGSFGGASFGGSAMSSTRMPSQSALGARGGRGGRGGRGRRRGRRRQRRHRINRAARRLRRRSRRGGGGGGGGGSSPGPQIVVIREGGGGEYDGDGYDGDYGDDDGGGDYEDDGGGDEADGFYSAGIGLSMGRIKDLPISPNGFNINYPAGG